MRISVSPGTMETIKAKLLVVPILEDGKLLPFQKKEMVGKEGKSYLLYDGYKGSEKVFLVGLGKKKDVSSEKVRKAFALAVRKARELETGELTAFLAGFPGHAEAAAEGLLLGAYSFDKYKSKKDGKEVKSCVIVAPKADVSSAVKICENVNFVRDLVNENADVMTPAKLAAVAKDVARKCGLRFRVLEKPQLKKLGMNLLLAVGQGSKCPPRMVVLEYSRGKGKPIVLVGKGITFDSGGLNLKPSNYIETMKQDMGGAAAVLGTIKTVAELKLKINLAAVIPLAENALGRDSYKPGDVFKGFSGKTVEIENTDAEGRLILADALAWAEKNLQPRLLVDIATLTGAALYTFGELVTPVIGTDKKTVQKLFAAGERTGERVWELPLYEEFKEEVKGEIADVRNLGYNKRYAGTIMGAAFLNSFVKGPLVHIDIGGTAWSAKGRGYIPKWATGVGVRLLTEFLRGMGK
ncbi:MAG: leucyl aminopeptidase [Candidatus Aenigmarchaeota archaeon]|nr:leucyl aminopeptidase [Candidatus Aenigmarchaeota archaeon]